MSTNYIPDLSPSFSDIFQFCSQDEGLELWQLGKGPSSGKAVPARPKFNPSASYFITDGSDTLHLNFSKSGTFESADTYGASNADELLAALSGLAGDFTSEHDDGYWEKLDPTGEFRAGHEEQLESLVNRMLS